MHANRLPPGPRDRVFGLSILGQIQRDLLGTLDRFHAEYGDAVLLQVAGGRYYLFHHPDQIREILVTKGKSFQIRPHVRRVFGQWNGNSVLTTEGEAWRTQRKLVTPGFASRRFAGYGEVMVRLTNELTRAWESRLARGEGTVEIDGEMTALTLRIIGETMFSADIAGETEKIGAAVRTLGEVAMRELASPFVPPPWLPWPGRAAKQAAIRYLDEFVWKVVRERRAEGSDRGDLLSMLLLAADDEEGGGGAKLTDAQVRDNAMTMLLAGHDTTAAGFCWIFYELARNPALQEEAAREVAALGARPLGGADVPRLKFCERFVKESLRLHPPTSGVFVREALEDVEIGGYPVRKGDLVQEFSYVVHRDPRWYPDPLRFDPDRFLPDAEAARPQFAYFPFGGGPRICVGQHFAMLEMILVLGTMLQTFEFALAPGQGEPRPVFRASLRPDGGIRLSIRRRERRAIEETAPAGSA